MTDIIKRLRNFGVPEWKYGLLTETADEIERLRDEVERLRLQNFRLQAQCEYLEGWRAERIAEDEARNEAV